MGYFNVLKGAYPSLQQVDKTLLVDAGATAAEIVRGSLVKITSSNTFTQCEATDSDDTSVRPYIVLVGAADFQAGMAGSIGQGIAGGVAKITALDLNMALEFQTDMFTGDFSVGEYAMLGADGKFVPHTTGQNAVAQVTAASTAKYVNEATDVDGRSTGAVINVLTLRPVFIAALT